MGKSLAESPIQGEVVPQDKPPDRYVVRSVEVSMRREGEREVGIREGERELAEFRESFAGNRLMKFFPRSLIRDGRNEAEIGLEDANRLGEHAEALEMMDSMENRENRETHD
jgi:hypothetical protein